MKWPWPPPRRGDIAAALMVLALVAGFLVVTVGRPGLFVLYDWGFGPGWTCSYAGQSEPVCIKSPARSAAH